MVIFAENDGGWRGGQGEMGAVVCLYKGLLAPGLDIAVDLLSFIIININTHL